MHTPNLDISNEFDKILTRVKNGKHFSFTRFGDGELHIVKHGEFKCQQWNISGDNSQAFRNALHHSLTYSHPDYFIGLPCSCREHADQFRAYLFNNFDLNSDQLTFSALFVNAMYKRLQEELIPVIKTYPIFLIANERSKINVFKKQGFNLTAFIPVPENAWKVHQEIEKRVLETIDKQQINHHIFLISAGPVANTLIPILHDRYPNNTYIDIGSSLDQQLDLPHGSRNYLQPHGWKKLARCVWHHPTRKNQITCSSLDKSKAYRAYLKLRALLT